MALDNAEVRGISGKHFVWLEPARIFTNPISSPHLLSLTFRGLMCASERQDALLPHQSEYDRDWHELLTRSDVTRPRPAADPVVSGASGRPGPRRRRVSSGQRGRYSGPDSPGAGAGSADRPRRSMMTMSVVLPMADSRGMPTSDPDPKETWTFSIRWTNRTGGYCRLGADCRKANATP